MLRKFIACRIHLQSTVGLIVLAWLTSIALSQYVSPPTDLITAIGYANFTVRYKEVEPGFCELNPNVKTYSGYVDVAPNQHIFFLFFQARNTDPEKAPLTVWLQGGPGGSSMFGAFVENGPCKVDFNGRVQDNPYSWTNASNMLYIDQPTQTGFSYSIPIPAFYNSTGGALSFGDVIPLKNGSCPANFRCGTLSDPNPTLTANSFDEAAHAFWATLQGFMGVFPQYSASDFNVAAESYGGQWGPAYGAYIQNQNSKNIPGATKINLKTLLIGNGLFQPNTQNHHWQNFGDPAVNTYDLSFTPGERDVYDIRELNPDPFPSVSFITYLNTPGAQSALGAFQNFTLISNTVYNIFITQGYDRANELATLVKNGVTVVLFHGDSDWECNWIGGEASANMVKVPGFLQAGYVNITTSDGIVHGQVKQSGAFSFVRIYQSGHFVSFYQPLTALELFERAINRKDIATGTVNATANYKTKGTKHSTFREGNSTAQFSIIPANGTIYNTTSNGPGFHS